MDSRELTPCLAAVVVHLAGEIRSFERAEKTTEAVLAVKVSRSTIRRVAKEVGLELAKLEETNALRADQEATPPEIAVVLCDGGRIRTREAGQGRGVRPSGENGWREDKIASFERMTPHAEYVDGADPCPQLPSSFQTAEKVAEITEKPLLDVDSPDADDAGPPATRAVYKGPRRILRTAVASMADSAAFGEKMKREAQRRQFHNAPRRAFIADGLSWNWTVWQTHFPTYIPILDFVHAIQYVFSACRAIHASDCEAWALYARLITCCWQGGVAQVIEELTRACRAANVDPAGAIADDHPLKPVLDAIRYLTNNRSRMDYPRYRRLGLPVTSAPMESLVKQVNLRVKGTEMFWDDPDGAEAILQLRAAALSDDGRLNRYLQKRPGAPYVRRTTEAKLAT